MDDRFETTDLDPARKSLLPGAGFFLPDDLEAGLQDERTAAALEGARVAVIADSDADGLACVALIREAYEDVRIDPEDFREDEDWADDGDDETDEVAGETDDTDDVVDETVDETVSEGAVSTPVDGDPVDAPTPTPNEVALIPASPHDVEEAMARVAAYAEDDIDCFVCDLAPDRYEYVADELAALIDVAKSVRWYDHHQWDEEVMTAVREAGVDLVVGDSDEECSADVVYRSLDADFDARFAELTTVTRDHDLWLREDPRSDDLADYAYWADPAAYVAVVREHGPDLPAWVEAFLTERRVEKDRLIEQAVSRAEYHDVGDYRVGVTYGRCSQNEVAEAMREAGADASVVIKPAGSASIRGTEAFQRCHEVAALVDGGGHPKAAGCKPDIYDDILDYATHWTTRGAVATRVILRAFEDVVETGADQEREDSGETA